MLARTLTPAERMADRFEQASTLDFTTVARVRGPLSIDELEAALRRLERRHPLLRARIAREGADLTFVPGEARPIPLVVEEGSDDALLARVTRTLGHAAWDDEGPRAELVWVRHGPERSSLLLRAHHVSSDGSSGVIAMRDLLAFVGAPDLDGIAPLPSPGQDAFFPAEHAELRRACLESLARVGSAPAPNVLRVARFDEGSNARRRTEVRRLRFTVSESDAIARRARSDGATVHGVLIGAMSLALARETGGGALQRWVHPVDLRRYLREIDPGSPPIGDAIGYYVSAVTTDHPVEGTEHVGELARTVTTAVRAAKEQKEPLLSAPVRGPLLVERTRGLGVSQLRELAERTVFQNTCALSNLGRLEDLGVSRCAGRVVIEDLFFVAASSVLGQLGGSAVSFDGRIALQLTCVEPLVRVDFLERLAGRVEVLLREYAG